MIDLSFQVNYLFRKNCLGWKLFSLFYFSIVILLFLSQKKIRSKSRSTLLLHIEDWSFISPFSSFFKFMMILLSNIIYSLPPKPSMKSNLLPVIEAFWNNKFKCRTRTPCVIHEFTGGGFEPEHLCSSGIKPVKSKKSGMHYLNSCLENISIGLVTYTRSTLRIYLSCTDCLLSINEYENIL